MFDEETAAKVRKVSEEMKKINLPEIPVLPYLGNPGMALGAALASIGIEIPQPPEPIHESPGWSPIDAERAQVISRQLELLYPSPCCGNCVAWEPMSDVLGLCRRSRVIHGKPVYEDSTAQAMGYTIQNDLETNREHYCSMYDSKEEKEEEISHE